MIKSIELQLDGKTIKLSPEDAKALLVELESLFRQERTTYVPYYPQGTWYPVLPNMNPTYPQWPIITYTSDIIVGDTLQGTGQLGEIN